MTEWASSKFQITAWVMLAVCVALGGCSAAATGPAGATTRKPTPDSGTAVAAPVPDASSDTDLAPPAADVGLQIATPDYDPNDANAKALVVPPGQEIFLCYFKTLPDTGAEIDVGAFQSWMSPASSHHFIAYYQGAGGPNPGKPQPDGTVMDCHLGQATGTWVYATSTPGQVVGMKMPDTVGLPFASGSQIMLNVHFINTSSEPLYPKVKLNILYAQNVQYKAASMISFNLGINIPGATSDGPGTQTVSGTCTAPMGANFFLMSTHTHKHATAAVVDFVSGGQTQEIVHTGMTDSYPADQMPGSGTDWEHPGVGLWTAPNFLTVGAGDSFTYSCSYTNTDTAAVTVGETAGKNEMCMAVGYYFPAGTTSCR